MKYVIAIFLILQFSLAIAEDTPTPDVGGVLSGRVVDAETNEPVAYCQVMLNPLGVGVLTDVDGRFTIRYLPPGTYQLLVAHVAHEPYREADIVVVAGKLMSRTIRLHPTAHQADPIVVTATRKEQTAKMVPASIMILKAEDLAARQITTFDQALETVPGVSAYRSSPISVQSMSIRGSSDVAGGGVGNRVLLLVDGRPALTADSGGAFWSLVPTNFIDRVEVVKGGFSSLYGSSAMGGVVNVITRRPDYQATGQIDFKVGFFEKAPAAIRSSNETPMQSEVHLSYSGASKRVSYLLSATRTQSDGHAEATTYEFYNLYSKMLFDLQDNRNLELTIGGGDADNDYPHTWLNSAQPLRVRPKFADDRQEKRYGSVDLMYWAIPGSKSKYSTRFYYYRHEQRSFFNEDDPLREIPGNEPLGTKTKIDGDKLGSMTQLDVYFSDDHYLVTGLDVQIDHVNSSPDTILYGNRQINNVALFAQDEIRIWPSLSLSAGARYDWNHLVTGKTLQQFSPKLGLVWSAVQRLTFRGLYGKAFRAPTIAELFFQREIAGGIDFVPNPDLTAEVMDLSVEAGVRWDAHRNLNFDAAAFRYEYENLIFWEDVADEFNVTFPLFQVRNLNRALLQGVELTVSSRWKDFAAVSANYTYLDAKDRSSGRINDTLPYRLKHSLKLATDLKWDRYQLHVDTRYRSGVEEVFLYPLQSPEAFWVTNSALRFQMSDRVNWSLKINNVFDASYEELARYRMPGRNWILGTSVRF